MTAARLVSEFGAQDVGAWLVVHREGTHIRVAAWNNANGAWDIQPAGHDLLNGGVEDSAEEVAPVEVAPKTRRKKVEAVVESAPAASLFPDSDE